VSLKHNLAEIVRIDKELQALVRDPVVRITSTLRSELKRLKDERRGHVRAIQTSTP
jgi:rRNA-processing protein FCF1